jgi:hypothetical protein
MKIINVTSIVGGLAIVTAGLLSNMNPAEAAALQGGVSFGPTVGNGNGVTFIGTGIFAPDTVTPLTDIDFALPALTGTGSITQTAAGTPPPLDFQVFTGDVVTIKDLKVFGSPNAQPGTTFPPFPITDFIVNTGKYAIDIYSVSFPTYSTQGGSTTVSIGTTAKVRNLLDGGSVSEGTLTFSADFAGKDIAATRALFDTAGESFGPNSWSATGVFQASVPESSNVVGLLAFGLVGSGFMIRKGEKRV